MKKLTALLFVTALTGCTVGPNYKRPTVDVPGAYRGAPPLQGGQQQPAGNAPQQSSAPAEQSLADQKWWNVFQDPQLQELIRTALKQNYDLGIAATRILQARAQLGITRANQFPTVNAGAGALNYQLPQSKFSPEFDSNISEASASVVWDLDFWGKYRRSTEAARANLLATEWARREIINSLVSDVSSAYFQLRAYDLQLEIARRTLASRQESLELTRTLADGGAATNLDVRQAEQLVAEAAETIPNLERLIQQQENYISTLLGQNPGPIARGLTLTQQPHAPEVPAGLPSSLLERRPDIREAEAQLMAANARIGVAKAAYYPDISLTATAGYASSALTSLFTGPAGFWAFGGAVTQPIFAGGRIKSGVRYSEAQQQEYVLNYRRTIQQAFRGVSDSLIGYQKYREYRQHQQELVVAAKDSAQLSEERYRGGATGYLEVLTNETNAFDAELGLAQAQANELLSLVEIYKNLGGGWQG
jgi:multidrug efflux system outer membrane protein